MCQSCYRKKTPGMLSINKIVSLFSQIEFHYSISNINIYNKTRSDIKAKRLKNAKK
jgi:hypothetical protein